MQIIVFNVNNLTDSRYFSAMMVDFLHMNVYADDLSFQNFIEIYDWVEGPKFICTFDRSLTIDKKEEIESLPNYFGEAKPIDCGFEIIPQNEAPFKLHYAKFATDPQKAIITDSSQICEDESQDWEIIGLVASGEHEVGVKDFDHFNEIFEKIRIF